MTLTVGVALLVVVAVVIALAVRRLRRPVRDAVAIEPRAVLDEEIATMPGEVFPPLELREEELPDAEPPEPAAPQPEPEPAITWTAALTETPLDEAARLRLIDDLALIAAPWTIALLRGAYREESSPRLRARIEAALATSGEPVGTTAETIVLAATSNSISRSAAGCDLTSHSLYENGNDRST